MSAPPDGFAKIATSHGVDSCGSGSSIRTMETRVANTGDQNRRRFRRYWMLAGPFGSLVRRMSLRLLAAKPRLSAPSGPEDEGFGS
jgi:hypothetical protein